MKTTKTVIFSPENEYYIITLKKRPFPWWILLLPLLLIILFIPIDETIKLKTINQKSHLSLKDADIKVFYTNEKYEQKELLKQSDSDGEATFSLGKLFLFEKIIGKNKNDVVIKAIGSKTDFQSDEILRKVIDLKENKELAVLKLNPLKDDYTEPPKSGCRAFFTGLVVSGKFTDGHLSKVYEEDKYSEYVGAGQYPDNEKAFPKAVKYTFDGIAIDSGTRVIIYKEKNFKGKILLDKTGPAIINNVKWKDDIRYSDANTEDYPEPLQTNFPQKVREWSNENMHDWSYGSLKVICK